MHPDDASGQLATPCVDGIYRYPVKGLTGQRIPRVDLRPGTGIPHDRRFAISNGHSRPPGDGAWTARAAFFHLAKNADLTQIGVTFDGHELAVQHPQLGQLSISVDQPESITQASAALATWFKDGAHGSARLVQARRGYWDGEQATLSLINLDTVTDLAAQAGHDLDPLRFRANIYLSGLAAWEEFNLVNRRIRIGDAELEILRPIDRCRATSVNPATGEVDVNLPALLGSRYGHIYCGLYARVVKAGSLAPGQQLRDLGRARPSQTDVVSSSTTETTQLPPRLADVLELVTEDRTVTSFWIRDPLRSKDAGGAAGKHIRVHAVDQAGPLWRSYSISAVQDDAIRISVKNHAQGRMSGLLHETMHRGDQLLISGPFGGAPFAAVLGQPVLLASAGVGITPILPILASLNRAGFASPLLLCHTARNATGLALWAEARKLVKSLPNARVRLHLTRPRDGDCERYGARPGRPQVAEVARQLLALDDTVGYICGPPSFVRHSQTSLELAGLPMHRLHHEVFHSPRPTAGVRIAPPKPGPFHVHFTASDVQAEWRPEAGTLLELGEQAGIGLPAGCREGACHTCRQQITAGATANLTEPMLNPPGRISPLVLRRAHHRRNHQRLDGYAAYETHGLRTEQCLRPRPSQPHREKSMTETSKPHRIITEVGTWPLVGLEGKEARLLTVEYPPGAHTPPHRHPGWQLIYVIKGKVTSQMEGEPLHDFNTGEHWFEPREHLHIDAGNDSPDARQDPRLYITEPGQPVLIPEPDHTSS